MNSNFSTTKIPDILLAGVIIIILGISLNSCSTEIEFEDITDEEYEDLKSISGQSGTIIFQNKGTTQKAWETIFKEAFKSPYLRKPLYFGLSNNAQLGDIVFRDNDGYSTIYSMGDAGINELEMMKLINPARKVRNFDLMVSNSSQFNLGALFDVDKLNLIDADLKGDLSKAKVVKFHIDEYNIDELKIGLFKQLVQKGQIANYEGEIGGGRKLVITKVLRVKGLTMSARLSKDLGADAKVKLLDLVKADSSKVNTIGAVFRYNGEKLVTIENDEVFVPFIQVFKGKKIRKWFFNK
jgi:hypothetical protein